MTHSARTAWTDVKRAGNIESIKENLSCHIRLLRGFNGASVNNTGCWPQISLWKQVPFKNRSSWIHTSSLNVSVPLRKPAPYAFHVVQSVTMPCSMGFLFQQPRNSWAFRPMTHRLQSAAITRICLVDQHCTIKRQKNRSPTIMRRRTMMERNISDDLDCKPAWSSRALETEQSTWRETVEDSKRDEHCRWQPVDWLGHHRILRTLAATVKGDSVNTYTCYASWVNQRSLRRRVDNLRNYIFTLIDQLGTCLSPPSNQYLLWSLESPLSILFCAVSG